eukprot:747711-Hanusia_phi.AAC.5
MPAGSWGGAPPALASGGSWSAARPVPGSQQPMAGPGQWQSNGGAPMSSYYPVDLSQTPWGAEAPQLAGSNGAPVSFNVAAQPAGQELALYSSHGGMIPQQPTLYHPLPPLAEPPSTNVIGLASMMVGSLLALSFTSLYFSVVVYPCPCELDLASRQPT